MGASFTKVLAAVLPLRTGPFFFLHLSRPSRCFFASHAVSFLAHLQPSSALKIPWRDCITYAHTHTHNCAVLIVRACLGAPPRCARKRNILWYFRSGGRNSRESSLPRLPSFETTALCSAPGIPPAIPAALSKGTTKNEKRVKEEQTKTSSLHVPPPVSPRRLHVDISRSAPENLRSKPLEPTQRPLRTVCLPLGTHAGRPRARKTSRPDSFPISVSAVSLLICSSLIAIFYYCHCGLSFSYSQQLSATPAWRDIYSARRS